MAFSVGAVTAKLTAQISDFNSQFQQAGKTVENFGKVTERTQTTLRGMQDRMDSMVRSQELLAQKSKLVADKLEEERAKVAYFTSQITNLEQKSNNLIAAKNRLLMQLDRTIQKYGEESKQVTEIEKKLKNYDNQITKTANSIQSYTTKNQAATSVIEKLSLQEQSLSNRQASLTAQMGTLGQRMSQTAKDGQGLYDRMDGMKEKIQETAKNSSTLGSKLEALQGISSKVGLAMMSLASTIGNILAQAFWRAVDAAKDFTTGLFDAAGQTEKQAIAFKVLLGSAEAGAKMMSDINKLSIETPFKIEELRDSAKQLLAFGFAQEEIIPTMKMLGDITAGTGGDFTLLGRAIGQVRTKGKLYAQELNQLGEQGLAVREIIANKLGVSVSELMTEMEKGNITVTWDEFNQVLTDLYKNKFWGMMEEQAQTLPGRWQNLTEQFSLMGQEILGINTETGKIIPGSVIDRSTTWLKNMLDWLAQNKDAVIELGKNVLTWVNDTFDKAKLAAKGLYDLIVGGDFTGEFGRLLNIEEDSGFVAAIIAARDAVKDFWDKTKEAFQWVIDNQKTVTDALIALGVGITVSLVPAFGAWAGAATAAAVATVAATWPILAVIGAVAGAVYLLKQAWDNDFLGMQTNLTKLWNEVLVPVGDWIKNEFTKAWDELSKAFSKVWDELKPVVDELSKQLEPVMKQIGDFIKEHKELWFALAAVLFGPIVVAIGLVVGAVWLLIKGFTLAAEWFAWLVAEAKTKWAWLKKTWEDGVENIKNIWNTITNAFSYTWGFIQNVWNQVVSFLKNTWQSIVDWLSQSWQQKLSDIMYWAGYIVGLVVASFYYLGQAIVAGFWAAVNGIVAAFWWVVNAGIAIWNGLVAFVLAIPGWLSQAWEAVKSAAIWAFETAKAWAIQKLTDIISFLAGLPAQAAAFWEQFKQAAIDKFNSLKDQAQQTFDNIKNIITGTDWVQLGKNIIQGIIDGIKNMAGELSNTVNNVVNSATSGFKDAMRGAGVPGFASGVQNFSGGWAIVGEQGPELVNLPQGSDVLPNPQTMDILGGGGGGNTTNNFYISGATNPQAVAQTVLQLLSRQNNLAASGLNR